MSLRTKYVLLYIASLIAPAIIFIGGAVLIYSIDTANNALSITSLYLICSLLFLVGGFFVNFWYGKILGLRTAWRVLASIFSTVGFFYLLSQDKNLISVVQIIKNSTELYTTHWKKLIKFPLLYLIPTAILGLVGMIILILSSRLHAPIIVNFIIILLIIAVAMIATLLLSICLADAIKKLLAGQPLVSLKQSLKENIQLLQPTIIVSFLSALIIIGGSILFLIPGIIFSIWYAFVFYAVIFEKQKGLSALRYSKSMVIGRWFAILWRFAVPALVFSAGAMLLTAILQLPLLLFPQNNVVVFTNSAIANLVSLALMPLTATASVILFLDAKKSKPAISEKTTPAIM